MSHDLNHDLDRHLDGELSPDALAPADRDRADAWERMVESFRATAPGGEAPAWLEQRVMAEIASVPEPGMVRRVVDWLVRPAPIRLSPLTAGLVAAAVAAVVLLPGRGTEVETAAAVGAESLVYVQFVLEAPSATSVAVAGDFSAWEPAFALEDTDGDGVWSARVPVQPGVHAYMFLIDETSWQTDPNAVRYQDDGFGNRNAVLAVGASG
jgi:hypothetical protein